VEQLTDRRESFGIFLFQLPTNFFETLDSLFRIESFTTPQANFCFYGECCRICTTFNNFSTSFSTLSPPQTGHLSNGNITRFSSLSNRSIGLDRACIR